MTDLYLLDERAPNRAMMDRLFNFIPDTEAKLVVMAMDPPSVYVQSAIAQLGSPLFRRSHGKVTRIHIVAHGAPGYLELGTGLTSDRMPQLAPLRTVLRTDRLCGVRIYGCNIAAANEVLTASDGSTAREGSTVGGWGMPGSRLNYTSGLGYNFLLGLARQLGVSVTGGLDDQNVLSRTNPDYLSFHFEGPTLTVDPSGELRVIIDQRTVTDSRFDAS